MSFDLELTTGLYHTVARLGPELSRVYYPSAIHQPLTRNSKISGKLRLVAPLLDSLISLLPYDKSQYAMTLALSKKSVKLYVSAADDSQLDLASQGMVVIKKCWDLLQDAINCKGIESNPIGLEQIVKSELVREFIVHHLTSGRQHARFQKRSRECAAWFALLRGRNIDLLAGEGARSYCDISESVYELYEDAIFKGHWTDKDIARLCDYADAIKRLDKQTKMELSFGISCLSRWFQYSNLEAGLPLPLNDLPHQWDFDASRYIDKLIRPAVHAIELYRLSKRSAFRRMFKDRPLRITEVRATEYGARYTSPLLSTDTVHSFIRGLRGETEDKETLIKDIDSVISSSSSRSHPVCHLIRYHNERCPQFERPFPYIATYKLPSHLSQRFVQLHRFLSQCNTACTSWVGFVLREWKAQVEMNWCLPVTSSEHIYSRLIGFRMQNDLVDILEGRMDNAAKQRARQDRIPLSGGRIC